ncbi:MAG: transporter substrate-binding domain-containing protein [Candidatus Accumulibacter sp.]|jgi:polar amino acid transport system substrate-binding protein|nr:transporter substrate-binding domain-containing protein [Accumulibacter sp.]
MKVSRLVALFAATAAATLFSGAASAAGQANDSIAAIKARGTVKIAVFSDKPPFGFVDKFGKNQGYDVYFARRFAKELLGDENKIEFVLVEPAARVDVLESGRVDIVFANFTVTPERAKRVDFAKPYFKTAIGVVSNDSTPIAKEGDLQGKKLIVIRGTTADVYFSKVKGIELVKYDQIGDAFQALRDGRGVGLAQDTTLVLAWANENKGFSVKLGDVGDVEPIAPAVRKGNTELRDWINATLVKLGKERFAHTAYDATLKPYYGANTNPDDLVVEGGAF